MFTRFPLLLQLVIHQAIHSLKSRCTNLRRGSATFVQLPRDRSVLPDAVEKNRGHPAHSTQTSRFLEMSAHLPPARPCWPGGKHATNKMASRV